MTPDPIVDEEEFTLHTPALFILSFKRVYEEKSV
jgi:hypothetical protein